MAKTYCKCAVINLSRSKALHCSEAAAFSTGLSESTKIFEQRHEELDCNSGLYDAEELSVVFFGLPSIQGPVQVGGNGSNASLVCCSFFVVVRRRVVVVVVATWRRNQASVVGAKNVWT
jgi:hypothetical protein